MPDTVYKYRWEGQPESDRKDGHLVCMIEMLGGTVEVWRIKLESFKEFIKLHDHFEACTNNGKIQALMKARYQAEKMIEKLDMPVATEPVSKDKETL